MSCGNSKTLKLLRGSIASNCQKEERPPREMIRGESSVRNILWSPLCSRLSVLYWFHLSLSFQGHLRQIIPGRIEMCE
jgi:hypothetical protein